MQQYHHERIDTYLRLKQVLKIIPVSRSTWYRGIQAGIYPTPVRLSHRVAAWKKSEIMRCLEQLDAAASQSLKNLPNHS
jgi:prophage regulatory protein